MARITTHAGSVQASGNELVKLLTVGALLIVGVVLILPWLLKRTTQGAADAAGGAIVALAQEAKETVSDLGAVVSPHFTPETIRNRLEYEGAVVRRGETFQDRQFATIQSGSGQNVTLSLRDGDLDRLNFAQRTLLRADTLIPGNYLTRKVLGVDA